MPVLEGLHLLDLPSGGQAVTPEELREMERKLADATRLEAAMAEALLFEPSGDGESES